MLKMAVGATEEMDGEHAAADVPQQCAAALDGETPRAGLLLASHDLDFRSSLQPSPMPIRTSS